MPIAYTFPLEIQNIATQAMVGIWPEDRVKVGQALFLERVEQDRLFLKFTIRDIPPQDQIRFLSERQARLPVLLRIRKARPNRIKPFEIRITLISNSVSSVTAIQTPDL